MTTPYSQNTPTSAFAVDFLIEKAKERAEATVEEMSAFIEPLEILAHALDTEARLSPVGRVAVSNALITSLITQVKLSRNILGNPKINEVPLEQPVFIIGMLRTGSTLVHNLLAQHSDLRVPNLWELMYPADMVMTSTAQEELANRAQSYVDEYFRVAPQLKVIHFLDARQPDECHRLLGNTFQSMVYEMRYRIPSYSRWLDERDLTQAYAYHQLQLKNILWRIPGKVVILKCPFHAWFLDALVRAYPTARFIHLHRNPTSIVLSTCSLCTTIRAGRSNDIDPTEIGTQWLAQIERGVTRMQEARRTYLSKMPVLDIRYNDLMSDTLGTMQQICHFIGVPITEQAREKMEFYLEQNKQNKHGTHRYTAEEFGLNLHDLDTRFDDYRKQYELYPASSK